MRRTALLAAPFLLVALAGCADDATPQATPDGDPAVPRSADGRDLRTDLTANDTLEAPRPWAVGDTFGIHLFFGPDDVEGTHIETIVVNETADVWILATDDPYTAKLEAAFDIPILGPMSKADLSTTGFGGAWELLSFPLTDGSTWQSEVQWTEDEKLILDFEATFVPDIQTERGARPGYEIIASPGGGETLIRFNYVPDVGWFTNFLFYDLSTEEADDYQIRAISMGTGHDWRGTYHMYEAVPLTEHFNVLAPDPEAVAPAPYTSFQVSSEADSLYGFVFAYAFGGVQEVDLIDPEHNRHEFRAVGAPSGFVFEELEIPALAGQWHAVTPGAGAVSVGGLLLWEMREHTWTL